MKPTIITVPGIGEQDSFNPIGMLKLLTDRIPADRLTHKFQHNWQNTYGPVPVWNGPAYAANVARAAQLLATRIYATDGPVIPIGYSGGAHVLSLALAQLRRDGIGGSDIPMVVTVSNPSRAVTDENSTGARQIPGRYGITGQHGPFPLGTVHLDFANPLDVICSCPPPPHPLRGFSDFTERFSLAQPREWGVDLLRRTEEGRWQNAWKLAPLPAWFDAVALLRGYMFDGQHTTWYVNNMPMISSQVLARWDSAVGA